MSYTTQDSHLPDTFIKDIRVFSPATNSWVIGRATFDTGSTYNWISKQFLEERLARFHQTLPQKHSRQCLAFSGHTIVPLGFVKLIWYEGSGRTTHEAQFLVCNQERRLFDVIVGSRTIAKEKFLSWHITTLWGTQAETAPVFGKGTCRQKH